MTGFEPGDTVSFTHNGDEAHWIVGEVEEIRKGHEGDHVLVVRQGGPWSGDRYVVLSSYVEQVGTESRDANVDLTSRHVSPDRALNMGKATQDGMTVFLN